jgi:hypothetical protein
MNLLLNWFSNTGTSSKSNHFKLVQMPQNKDKFQFLLKLTNGCTHSGKSFYQHLVNVYMALKKQKLSEEVCDAGLFHSIYGTEFYKFRRRGEINRDIIRHIIGEYAENLVYIFCTSKPRFETIIDNTLNLTNQQVIDLCFIEFANIDDQNESGYRDRQLEILIDTIARLQNEEISKYNSDSSAEVETESSY